MDKKFNKIKTILKSKFFLKLFFIPFGIWFALTLLALADRSDPDALTLADFVFGNIEAFIIWFIISFPIALLHSKKEAKDIKKGRTPEKKWEEKTTFKKIRFPLIMSIITFIIGIFLSYDSIGFPLKAQLIIFLAAFIPCILFLIFLFVIYKNKEKQKVYSVFKTISIVITCLLLFYYFITLFVIAITEATNPMTNSKYYSYHIFITPGLKDTFPNKIPKNVENVSFYYAPGVLQGGTRYTLYYVDKKMTLDEFDKKYKKKAEWIGHKNDYKDKPGLLSGAFYTTPSEYKNENDYTIYLIYGRCYKPDSCNHGDFKIAAFNDKTHEVIYSAESW